MFRCPCHPDGRSKRSGGTAGDEAGCNIALAWEAPRPKPGVLLAICGAGNRFWGGPGAAAARWAVGELGGTGSGTVVGGGCVRACVRGRAVWPSLNCGSHRALRGLAHTQKAQAGVYIPARPRSTRCSAFSLSHPEPAFALIPSSCIYGSPQRDTCTPDPHHERSRRDR